MQLRLRSSSEEQTTTLRLLAGLCVSLMLVACTGRPGASAEDLGIASVAIGVVPDTVACVRIAVTGQDSVTRLVDVVPGSTAVVALGRLPLGQDTFSGDAFPLACADVGSIVPTWASDAVVAQVAVDPPVQVSLVFRPNGRAVVSADFSDGGDGGGGPPNTTHCDPTGCACAVGFADCDGTLTNGCEVDVASDSANCGGCGVVCPGPTACVGGTCQPTSGRQDGGASDESSTGDAADAGDAIAPGADAVGPACTGDAGFTVPDGGALVPLGGTLRQIRLDPCGAHVYVSNQTQNEIEDYSIAAGALAAPIAVGSQPNGFDITADGARLYVANTGGTNISVVDLTARAELHKINTPTGFSNDTPFSLAIAANGKALFSTTFAGSGFGGRMLSLDLATEVVSPQSDFFINGMTTEATVLKASADRSVVAAVAGDISSAPVFVYRAATGAFRPERDLNGFISEVALNSDGTEILVDGTFVLDGNLAELGTVARGGGPWAVFAPTAHVAYRVGSAGIDVIDTARFLVTSTIPVVADTMQGSAFGGSAVGNMAISSDGTWLAMITDHGISLGGVHE